MGKHRVAKKPPSKTLSRKQRRKEERKLKGARRNAYAQRNFDLIKTLANVDTAFKAKCQNEKVERLKRKKAKQKTEQKKLKKQEDDGRIQGLKLAIQKDEKELKQLEKNLKFRKKKGKTSLPTSFLNDGLDYILDATDSEKVKSMGDTALDYTEGVGESDSEMDSDETESLDETTEAEDTMITENTQKWDPSAKATKSILKREASSTPRKKNVIFTENRDDDKEEGDSDEDSVGEDSFNDSDDNRLDSDQSSDEDEQPSRKRSRDDDVDITDKETSLKEDIYGRLRDSKGNIVNAPRTGTYIPPAKRALVSGGQNEGLRKRLKGLVNKVSEGTIQTLSSHVELLYLEHSRNDVNETIATLILEAVVSPVLSPERLVAELVMLIAILHSNIGSEVGAFFVQKIIQKFDDLLHEPDHGDGKTMENVLLLISNIYNFKIIHSRIIFDIMEKFIETFTEKDIERLLLLLKTVGFTLRKDDPVKLKKIIVDIQTKAKAAESAGGESLRSRIRFMLDVLMAVRNNNMRKIPNYDPSHTEHLKKVIKNILKGAALGEDQLNIGLEDILRADQVGRWWIVGSAWEGRKDQSEQVKEAKARTETSVVGTVSKQMLRLAKQQGMNTDVRRHIFFILGSSEDFEDAFARLMRLGLNRTQEREIIHVMFHCCLNEQEYNPFYGYLAQKFCTFDRRFTMTIQFSIWDKFKEIDKMEKHVRSKLAQLLSHLLISKSLSLSVFKVVEFGMEGKKMIRFLSQVLTQLLSTHNEASIIEIFERIAPFAKLKSLRQGLQVFMRIHLKQTSGKPTTGISLLDMIEKAESAMFSHQTSTMLL